MEEISVFGRCGERLRDLNLLLSPQSQSPQPSVHLPEGILLPLIRGSSHQLESPEFLALCIPLAQQRFDQVRVLTIAQRFGIQTQVHIQGADVGHVFIAQQQPWHGAAYDGKTSLEASKDLSDFDKDGFDCRRCAVVVLAR
jgi:hypothetical protein